MTKKPSAKRTINMYKSYSFVDKDPIIDRLRTVLADEGETYAKINEMSGVSTSTLYNWFDGPTQRPQFATVMAVARALGYDLTIAKIEGTATVVQLRGKRKRSA